ncbi:uncharacterized protein LOC117108507 [Anneissia japonica]|uniref:uncharacterized protein LOC117108507 n=1 Tax=Anneissia japonica TaxID=1529436 RepID=UPI001425A426|nr:uncharacterized protein LOC117108507 [Anneissia japonica]
MGMKFSSCFFFVFLSLRLYPFASATHFRGALFTWRPTSEPNQIEISWRISWRRSYSGLYCDDGTIANGALVSGQGQLICDISCSNRVGLSFYCTDFSVGEDWTSGVNTVTFDAGTPSFEMRFSGRDWISLAVSNGLSWSLPMSVNLTLRQDIGRPNSSPLSSITPIIRFQHGCNHTLIIPVTDPDEDTVRCRWAVGSRECGSVCGGLPFALLEESTCTIRYEAKYQLGWHAVAVMIEDFASPLSASPLSKIPLQFLVNVFSSNGLCSSAPEFVNPTPKDGACIGVPENDTYVQAIVVRSGGVGVGISAIETVSPLGFSKTGVSQVENNDQLFYVNVTWTPTNQQQGENILCYIGENTAGQSTPQSCIKLVAGVSPPTIIPESLAPNPGAEITSSQSEWRLKFDKEFVRPSKPTFIRFYDGGGSLVYSIDVSSRPQVVYKSSTDRSITITTEGILLLEKQKYYILMDSGVATGLELCGPESPPLRDRYYWTFTIRDTTPPVLEFVSRPSKTSENITITWRYNENSTSTCTLRKPSGLIETVRCVDETWSATGLDEGSYDLYVTGTDISGNVAESSLHSWIVDSTAPVVTIRSKPSSQSNDIQPDFQFQCNENYCTYECSVFRQNETSSFEGCSRFFTTDLLMEGSHTIRVRASDQVGNVGTPVEYMWLIDVTPPNIQSLPVVHPIICGEDFSSITTGVPDVTDTQDINPELSSEDIPAAECTINRMWTAVDAAGNSATLTQILQFSNPLPPILNIDESLLIPCGDSLEGTTDAELLIEEGLLKHPCGREMNVIYTDSVDVYQCDITFSRIWTISDDCGNSISEPQMIRVLPLHLPVQPIIGQINVDRYETLIWPSYPGSETCRLYVWPQGDPRPEDGTFLTSLSYFPNDPYLQYTQYLWQVEYILDAQTSASLNVSFIPSPVWGFETRTYPDLIVTEVHVQPEEHSGEEMTVSWTVENIGYRGSTVSTWYDTVYLSRSQTIQPGESWRIRQEQKRFLDPNDGYMASATFTLADDDVGTYFVFVFADEYRYINDDIDSSNNIGRSETPVIIKLTPPPDLQVKNVIVPESGRAASGKNIDVGFTVINVGYTATKPTTMHDAIFLTASNTSVTFDNLLAKVPRSNGIAPNEEYTVRETVTIPRKLEGVFWIYVVTDYNNDVYEHLNEDNNGKLSESAITVFIGQQPDLVPTLLESPSEAESTETITISWSGENKATEEPFENFWEDRLTISGPDLDPISISTQTFSGDLHIDEQYDRHAVYKIPSTLLTGIYNLTIHIDYRNQVFEYENDANNVKYNSLYIYQKLPDLQVGFLNATPVFDIDTNTAWLHVNWRVVNHGAGSPGVSYWTDRLYLSMSQGIDYSQPIGEVTHMLGDATEEVIGLPPDSSYLVETRFDLPQHYFGEYKLIIKSDFRNQINEEDNLNNEISISVSIPQRISNLVVTNTNFGDGSPKEAVAGDQLYFEWTVSNEGNWLTSESEWTDVVYLSRLDYVDISAIVIGSVKQFQHLNPGASYTSSIQFVLPDNLWGTVFILIYIDNDGELLTHGLKTIHKEELKVSLPPSPQLGVIDLQYNILGYRRRKRQTSDFSSSTRYLSVTWSIRNSGNSMFKSYTWSDAVIITTEKGVTEFPTGNVIGTFQTVSKLYSGQIYNVSKIFVIPDSIKGGTFYVYVIPDYYMTLAYTELEILPVFDVNKPVDIPVIPEPDLEIIYKDTIPATITAGETIFVKFQVVNIGGATSVSSWNDAVILDDVSQIAPGDSALKLTEIRHLGSLGYDGSYQVETIVTFPFGIKGSYTLFIQIDTLQSVEDVDKDNNIFRAPVPIDVLPAPLPDIVPYLPTLGLSLRSGEPFSLHLNITNIGVRDVNQSIYNSVYLSEDTTIDPFDRTLLSVYTALDVAINETYVVPLEVFMPYDIPSAGYYIIVKIDSRDDMYEINNNNNVASIQVSIVETVSTDIVVVSVQSTPPTVKYNDDIMVEWRLLNNGSLNAKGYKCDTTYLSVDDKWSIDDEELGVTCSIINLPGSGQSGQQYSMVTNLPLVNPVNYNTIVRTRSNIRDLDLDNNIGVAITPTLVDMDQLILDTPLPFQLGRFEQRVFRVRDVVAEETLVFSLRSNTDTDFNELYVKYGEIVTAGDYDATGQDFLVADQDTAISNSKAGDYFVLAKNLGSILANEDSEFKSEITLFVKYAELEILDFFPQSAASFGITTLRISGTLFPEEAFVFLTNNSIVIEAVEYFHFSSLEVYARFNLSGIRIGSSWFVQIVDRYNSKLQATSRHSLEIIDGIPGAISLRLNSPGALRPEETARLSLFTQNIGNTDVITPMILIEVIGDATAQLIRGSYASEWQSTHNIYATSQQGPSGIIPPGSYSQVTIDIRPNNFDTRNIQLRIIELKPSANVNHPYVDGKETLRPGDTDQGAWDQIWINFISYVGMTQLSLAKQLSSTANQLSLINRRPIDTAILIDYFIKLSNGFLAGTSLYTNTDLKVDSPYTGFNELILKREISALVSHREYNGLFGRGWRIQYVDTRLEEITGEFVKLRRGYIVDSLSIVTYNLYELPVLGTIEIKADEIVFADRQSSIVSYYHFDKSSKLLQYIDNDLDKSKLYFHYAQTSNRLERMVSTSDVTIDFLYSNAGLIETVIMSVSGEEVSLASYRYDIDSQFLTSSDINGQVTYYSYTNDGALEYVTYSDGSIQKYLYDERKLYSGSSRVSGDGVLESSLNFTNTGNGRIEFLHMPSTELTTIIVDEIGNAGYVKSVGSVSHRFIRDYNNEVKTVYVGDQILKKETHDVDTGTFFEVDPNGDETSIAFSPNGDILSITDGNGNIRTGAYEDKETIITYPDMTTEKVTYDDNNYISTFKSRSDKITEFNYDDGGNLVYKKIHEEDPIYYQYNERGFVTQATNAVGTISIRYNDNGFPLSVTYPNGKELHYEYERNLRTRLYDNEGYDIKYVYDKFERLINIVDDGSRMEILRLEYDELQRVTERKTGNNCSTIYNYSAIDNRLEGQYMLCPNTNGDQALLVSESYEFDGRGRLKVLNTTHGTWRYGYDSASQLISWTDPTGKSTEIKYDNAGNRRILKVKEISNAYAVNNLNQYKSFGKYETWIHDLNGNLIEITPDNLLADTERYTFNDENRLKFLSSSSQDCSLEYDALGNLYRSTCAGQTTQYLVDPFGYFGGEIISEQTIGHIQKYIFAGLNGLVALKKEDNEIFYYQFDRLGSTNALTDANGQLANTYQYDPFGGIISKTERISNKWTFVGQWGVRQIDVFSHLYYMRSRIYDHRHGRFLSPDPLGINGKSYNAYVYLSNDPLSGVDPRGTLPAIVVSGGFGGLFGVGTYVVGNLLAEEPLTWTGTTKAFVTGVAGGVSKAGALTAALITGGGNILEEVLKGTELKDYDWEGIIQESLVSAGLSKIPFGDMFLKSANSGLSRLTRPTIMKILRKSVDKIKEFLKKTFSSIFESYVNKLVDYIQNILEKGGADALDEFIQWLTSIDPNDIVGPAGYGDARFMPTDEYLTYKIRFENDINATAPAQRVLITTILDDNIDSRTLRIGDFGFGNFTNEVERPSGSYQKRIDFVDIFGFFVKVDALLDYRRGEILWDIRAIDPETNQIPTDPRKGFLPPNPENGTDGQGYVTFSVKPRFNTIDLSVIDAKASIIFDQNDPIDTPPIFNTIDSGKPEVNITVDDNLITSGILVIHIESGDGGSGVSFVDIFTDTENGREILVEGTTDTTVTLNVPVGVTYNIIAIPRDNVGNSPTYRELQEQNKILSVDFPVVIVSCTAVNNCSGYGTCTGQNLCSCEANRYGAACDSVVTPVEPPVVGVQSAVGEEDSKISLAVTVEPSMSNFTTETTLIIKGAPHGAMFSHGLKRGEEWHIQLEHLPELIFIPPPNLEGYINLILLATTKSDHGNAVRRVDLPVYVAAVADIPALMVSSECFHKDQRTLIVTISASSTDTDGSENITSIILSDVPDDITVTPSVFLFNNTYELSLGTAEFELYTTDTFRVLSMNVTVINTESENGHQTSVSEQFSIYNCQAFTTTSTPSDDGTATDTFLLYLAIGAGVVLLVFIVVLGLVIALNNQPLCS